jgi:hypothetical protein
MYALLGFIAASVIGLLYRRMKESRRRRIEANYTEALQSYKALDRK